VAEIFYPSAPPPLPPTHTHRPPPTANTDKHGQTRTKRVWTRALINARAFSNKLHITSAFFLQACFPHLFYSLLLLYPVFKTVHSAPASLPGDSDVFRPRGEIIAPVKSSPCNLRSCARIRIRLANTSVCLFRLSRPHQFQLLIILYDNDETLICFFQNFHLPTAQNASYLRS
jgi:hypothetical protein